MTLRRARGLGETYRLARAAAELAGVTRLADISGLAGLGLPVFQAVRPFARSLTVSQGKGLTPLAAKISALLESCELAIAEALPCPTLQAPLAQMPLPVRRYWSGDRGPLTIDLDPAILRGWVEGRLLGTDEPMPTPWDLLSLDFTITPLEYPAGSDGLATGNTRDEAILAALGELLEHDLVACFEELGPVERRGLQIDTDSIDDPILARELAMVRATGFTPRLWSLGQKSGVPAFACKLFAPEPALDAMAPTGGSACHPHRATAALAALREAVQGRAALVAGARDDIVPDDYIDGRDRVLAIVVATLAATDGRLDWSKVPTFDCGSTTEGIAFLRLAVARLTPLPVVVFDHRSPVAGLYVVHALSPGLRKLTRRAVRPAKAARLASTKAVIRRATRSRAVLFAGPSIVGLAIPPEVALRPPAMCGDLVALLADPPTVVGLADGYFGLAPSVWHKEILALLSRGVRVIGAASLGALRAAELAESGMVGVGAIHAAYRAGTIERDDAVMLLHAPADYGFAPLTLPLVDAEYVLNAVTCGSSERRMMQRIVRTMAYETRTWQRCLDAYRARTGSIFPVSLAELLGAPSLKRMDAALLIEKLHEAAREPAIRPACSQPPMTSHFLRMLARIPADAVPAPVLQSSGGPAGVAAPCNQSIR